MTMTQKIFISREMMPIRKQKIYERTNAEKRKEYKKI